MSDSEPLSPSPGASGQTFTVPAAVVREVLSDDELVVLDTVSHRFYSLNTTGKRIYELAAQGLDRATIVARLAEEFDVPPSECAEDVETVLSDLLERGLLAPRKLNADSSPGRIGA